MATAEVKVEVEVDIDESRAACEGCSLNGGEKSVGECALIGALAPTRVTVLARSVARVLSQASKDSFTIADAVADDGGDGKYLYQQTNSGLQAIMNHAVLGPTLTELEPIGVRKVYTFDLEALQSICKEVQAGELSQSEINLSKSKKSHQEASEEQVLAGAQLALIGKCYILGRALPADSEGIREILKVCQDEQIAAALRLSLNLCVNEDGYATDPDASHRLGMISAICSSENDVSARVGALNLLITEEDKPVEEKTEGQSKVNAKGWQDFANCLGVDPDLFFPERGASTREAKEVCKGCVVREDCLEYSLANGEKFGIWGGLSERERRRIRRQRSVAKRATAVAVAEPAETK